MNQFAIVFPGQGSQSLGMLADISEVYPEVLETFAEASEVLAYDLWALVKNGPSEKLDQTVYTQPALLAASYAIWRILNKTCALPQSILAGHSLGEYTALVCAEALSFKDGIKLVSARGQYMQAAVPADIGGMAAIIGLDEVKVAALCEEVISGTEYILSPANFNSIGQVVIAGHKVAVEQALSLAKTAGAKMAIMIPVSVPSHCALMFPAAQELEKLLTTIELKTPKLPILNNVHATFYQTPDEIRTGLVKQLYAPVRWVDIIKACMAHGVTKIIECGPGKILTGLNKRIDKTLQLTTTNDLANLTAVITEMNGSQ